MAPDAGVLGGAAVGMSVDERAEQEYEALERHRDATREERPRSMLETPRLAAREENRIWSAKMQGIGGKLCWWRPGFGYYGTNLRLVKVPWWRKLPGALRNGWEAFLWGMR